MGKIFHFFVPYMDKYYDLKICHWAETLLIFQKLVEDRSWPKTTMVRVMNPTNLAAVDCELEQLLRITGEKLLESLE